MKIIERINKKVLCIFVALTMVFSLVMMNTGVSVHADSAEYNATTKTITFDGSGDLVSATVNTAFTAHSDAENVVVTGYTSIHDAAFYDKSQLISVTIGNGVTSIGEHSFQNCNHLTSITIPDSVTSIGAYAFSNCYDLTSITIPDGITSIQDHTFFECNHLTSITIPDSVTTIGANAFTNCTALESITIPDSVTTIGDWAFGACSKLTSVTLKGTVGNNGSGIASNAFYNVGTSGSDKTTLYLPKDAGITGPANNSTAWKGGYFKTEYPERTKYSDDITVSWKEGYIPKVGDTVANVKENLVLSDSGDNGKLEIGLIAINTDPSIEGDSMLDTDTLTENVTYYFTIVVRLKDYWNNKFDVNNYCYTGNVKIFGSSFSNVPVGDSFEGDGFTMDQMYRYNAIMLLDFLKAMNQDPTSYPSFTASPVIATSASDVKYDETDAKYTAKTNGIGAVTTYYKANGTWTTTKPTEAGSYEVGFSIAAYNNYTAFGSDSDVKTESPVKTYTVKTATTPAATPSAATATAAVTEWKVGEKKVVNNATLTKLTDTTVSLKNKTIHTSTIKLPSTVTVDNKTYKITSLKRDCVHGHYVKKLVIPSTVTQLEYACFAGDKHLTSIKINSSKLTLAKNLFRNISKKQRRKIKVTISKNMSKKKFNAVRIELVKQGLKWSNIKRK